MSMNYADFYGKVDEISFLNEEGTYEGVITKVGEIKSNTPNTSFTIKTDKGLTSLNVWHTEAGAPYSKATLSKLGFNETSGYDFEKAVGLKVRIKITIDKTAVEDKFGNPMMDADGNPIMEESKYPNVNLLGVLEESEVPVTNGLS